jgi:hypothetical protein
MEWGLGIGPGIVIVIRKKGFVLLLIFGQDHGFAAEAGEGVEEPRETLRIIGEGFVLECPKDLNDGKLDGGLVELDGVIILEEVSGALTNGHDLADPGVVAEVVLVTAVEPIGNVFKVELEAVFGHFETNGFVSGAVVEEVVDEVALGFGQLGDFPAGFAAGDNK